MSATTPGAPATRRRSLPSDVRPPRAPRLGFLGVGWIGRVRLESVAREGSAEVVAVADPCEESRLACAELVPQARQVERLDDLLAMELDGIVIATPSALHARAAERVLREGVAVFCQKPLGRNERECLRVIDAARVRDRLLGVDLCYRHTRAASALRDLVRTGTLGRVYALDLVFHNASGPDKSWFYQRSLSGGGCLLDLGTHLVDLALWLTDESSVVRASGTLLRRGRPLRLGGEDVEDYATAELTLASGARARLACSWGLSAGAEALISVRLHGSAAGAALHNVGGSFYDFVAERYEGTRSETLVGPPDEWGGRALTSWVRRLRRSPRYDPRIETVVEVARTIDCVYAP